RRRHDDAQGRRPGQDLRPGDPEAESQHPERGPRRGQGEGGPAMSEAQATELRFVPVAPDQAEDTIAVVALNRPEAANAFNDAVISELISHLEMVGRKAGCRALVIKGRGKHFSAGADLGWMKASATLSYDENIRDAEKLIGLF